MSVEDVREIGEMEEEEGVKYKGSREKCGKGK